jgi:hypothetical protein
VGEIESPHADRYVPKGFGPLPAQMKPIPGVAEATRVTDEGLTENTKRMMREFTTGATRNLDEDKHDYEGFLSPYVLRRFAAYMHEHRKTPGACGTLTTGRRASRRMPT